jgi:diguanylate cyclase (GGDEF)-like protein
VIDEASEQNRLRAIERVGAVDRIADPALQGLARIAAYVTGASAAAVHIIDGRLQRRIAAYGAPLEDVPRHESMCRLVVENGEPIVTADATGEERFDYSPFVTGPGAVRFYASVPLRTQGGEIIGTVCAFDEEPIELPPEGAGLLEDLAMQATTHLDLMALVSELGDAATQDSLTGAANRLILNDRLAHHLARRRRHGEFLVVAAVDIDRFKAVNDRYGHAAGDAVLREAARRLAASVRAEDTVARVGGDEFIVVAELGVDGLPADSFATRLTEALDRPVSFSGTQLPCRATVGAVLAGRGDSATDLLRRADAAMYKRKRAATVTEAGSGAG